MGEIDKEIKAISESFKEGEISYVDFLSDKDIQKSILKNLIQIKYLLRKIIYGKERVQDRRGVSVWIS